MLFVILKQRLKKVDDVSVDNFASSSKELLAQNVQFSSRDAKNKCLSCTDYCKRGLASIFDVLVLHLGLRADYNP